MDGRGLLKQPARRGAAPENARGQRAVRRGLPCRKRHDLKCWPAAFEATVDGDKTFEFRLDDRGYEVGDWLLLREWVPLIADDSAGAGRRVIGYTGRAIEVKVNYILRGPAHDVPIGYAVMSIRPKLAALRLSPKGRASRAGK